ncbi:MAG: choice-of-anchor D domain-containing protein [Candidatus Sulfotelmatobacter sp.]
MSGTLGIASNASDPMLSVSLAGTGVLPGTLAVSPTAVNFGSAEVGTTVTQTGTLSAGNAAITVSSAGVSGSQFSLSGISLPVTIAAGSSKSFQLAYAPTTAGTASANVTFLSNASNSSATLPLTGTATAAPPPSVTLSWNASTSSGVDGYNLYRGTVSGGPYTRLNSTLNTTMSATDNTVAAGQTYYYVTTAVNAAGTESAYSNQVQAVVPSP